MSTVESATSGIMQLHVSSVIKQ